MTIKIDQKQYSFPSSVSWIFCFFLVFISSFFLSGQHAPQFNVLDDSWQIILEYAFERGFQFGSDINFTFGPLGFLSTSVSQGHLIAYRIVFAILQTGVIAWVVITFARRISAPIRYFFILWFMIGGYNEEHWLLIIAFTALILVVDLNQRRIASAFLIFFIAVISLIKFTFFLVGPFTIAVCMAYKIAKKKVPEAFFIGVWFVCIILISWVLSSQGISNIFPWLKSSFAITSGYGDAMAVMPDLKVFFFSISAVIVFIASVAIVLVKSKRLNKENLVFIMLIICYVFLSWKHGFVRADDHIFRFINFLPLAFALLFIDNIQTEFSKKIRYILTGLYIVSIVLCTFAANAQSTDIMYWKFVEWPLNVNDNFNIVSKILTGKGDQVYEALNPDFDWQKKNKLPLAAKIIGKEPVDVVNFLQWSAIAAGFNYQPRPIFHGYSAYTSYLQDINLEFFRNKRIPYILLNMETIDNRFPTLDDAALIPYIFNNYLPVGKDENFLILKRIEGDNNYSLHLLHEQFLGFGEKLDVSIFNKKPIFLQVSIEPSIVEKIQNLFFQPFPMYININSKKGVSRYRFIPGMAERGFLLSPIIKTKDDLIDFLARQSQDTVESIYFEADYNFGQRSDLLKVKVFSAENFPSSLNDVEISELRNLKNPPGFYIQ